MNINSKFVYKKPDVTKIEILGRKTLPNGVSMYQVKWICPHNKLLNNRITFQPINKLTEYQEQLKGFQRKLDESIVDWSPFQQNEKRSQFDDKNMFNNFKNSGIIFNKANASPNNEVQPHQDNNKVNIPTSLGKNKGGSQFPYQKAEKIGNIFLYMEKKPNQMEIDVESQDENQFQTGKGNGIENDNEEDRSYKSVRDASMMNMMNMMNDQEKSKQTTGCMYQSDIPSIEEQKRNIEMFSQLKRVEKIKDIRYSNKKFKKSKNILINNNNKEIQESEKISSVRQIYEEDKSWYAIVELENNDNKIIFRDDLRILAPQLLLQYYEQLFEKKRKQLMMLV